jgi:hypothetical protein
MRTLAASGNLSHHAGESAAIFPVADTNGPGRKQCVSLPQDDLKERQNPHESFAAK